MKKKKTNHRKLQLLTKLLNMIFQIENVHAKILPHFFSLQMNQFLAFIEMTFSNISNDNRLQTKLNGTHENYTHTHTGVQDA